MTQYFMENASPEISPFLLWEVHKAPMRGRLIELGARRKREHGLQDLVQQVADLERKHKLSQHITDLEALTIKRDELKVLWI